MRGSKSMCTYLYQINYYNMSEPGTIRYLLTRATSEGEARSHFYKSRLNFGRENCFIHSVIRVIGNMEESEG